MLFVPADEVLCRHVTTIFAPKVSADRDSAQLFCPGQRSAKLSGTALSYIVLHDTFPYIADAHPCLLRYFQLRTALSWTQLSGEFDSTPRSKCLTQHC